MAEEDDGRRRRLIPFPFPASSRPREAPGGIKAHSRRGAFGQSWWARRWLGVLERLELGGRLGRGRNYARRGQVLDIAIEEGRVTAAVQGSRRDPYRVAIGVAPIPPAAWPRLGAALRAEARFAAKLLAGFMPPDIEEAFGAAGVSLFPASRRELVTECSCPDVSNPCKHIAAVYYLLGEEFDRDPFLIFRLRGLSPERLGFGSGDAGAADPPDPVARGRDRDRPSPSVTAVDPAAFWSGAETAPIPVEPSPDPAAWLERLGPFPFWRASRPLAAFLVPVYREAARRAVELAAGGAGRPSDKAPSGDEG
jgi:uncharacterized Zn finger protein